MTATSMEVSVHINMTRTDINPSVSASLDGETKHVPLHCVQTTVHIRCLVRARTKNTNMTRTASASTDMKVRHAINTQDVEILDVNVTRMRTALRLHLTFKLRMRVPF